MAELWTAILQEHIVADVDARCTYLLMVAIADAHRVMTDLHCIIRYINHRGGARYD